MRVTNHARTGVAVHFYLNSYREEQPLGLPLVGKSFALKNNESKDLGLGHDWVQMRIRVNREGARPDILYDSNDHNARTFNNRRHYVISAYNKERVVDWSTCKSKWQGTANEVTLTDDAANPEVYNGMQVATALLSGLVTGLAAAGGPVGMAGGGLTAGLGPLLLMAFSTEDKVRVPPPPDIAAIEAAVEKVVSRELDKQDAAAIASNFYGTSDRFLRIADRVYQQWLANRNANVRKSLRSQDLKDLEEFIDGIENNTNRGSVLSDIDLVCSASDIAKYMIPAFLAGIATTIHVKRMHELKNAIVSKPTDDELKMDVGLPAVQNVRDHVAKCIAGLERAVAAYKAHRTELVKEESLFGTPLQSELETYMNRAILGLTDLSTIETAQSDLKEIQRLLDEDLKNKKVKNFWRELSMTPATP
jgi:hypothetical protein